MTRLVCGVGYDSKSKGHVKTVNRVHTKPYTLWKDMLYRCYNQKGKYYGRCKVSDAWLDYQNFAEWMDNTYKVGLALDKDLLGDGTLYSEHTCAFIPTALNLFTTHTKSKGSLGVCHNKRSNTYTAYCNDGKGNTVNLGSSPDHAVCKKLYLTFKSELAKKLADEYYRNKQITKNIYEALISFDINIT